MSAAKKPRADSVLKTLPPERQSAIAAYAREHTLQQTVAWLAADGLKTSDSSLSDFLSWFALQQQLKRNESTVETLVANMVATRPGWTPEQIHAAGQSFFTALAMEQQNVDAWVLTQRLALQREQLALEDRRVKLLEQKAAAYDEVKKAVNSGGLTPETLAKIERELKLL